MGDYGYSNNNGNGNGSNNRHGHPHHQQQGNPFGYSNSGPMHRPGPMQQPQGEAASYYAGAQNFAGPRDTTQYHQQNFQQQEIGPNGERGFLGAVGGGVAGGMGGHAIGGRTGHGKLSTVLGVVGGAFAGHKLQDGVSDWKDEKKEKEKREEEERKRREEEDRRRREENEKKHCHSPPPPQHHNNNHNDGDRRKYAGNFSNSARDIKLDTNGEYTLHASCRRLDGSYQHSSISLNKIIENERGSFSWVVTSRQQSQGSRTVTVQAGDTLRGIAAQVGCSFDEIARHNGIQNADLIYPGQVLNVPGRNGGGCGGGGGAAAGNFGASAKNVRLVDGGKKIEGELLRDGRWVESSIVLDERIGNDNGTLVFRE